MKNYVFHDEIEWEENNCENKAVQNFFFVKTNLRGVGVAQALYARVAHMSSAIEERAKHVELRDNLMQHIMTTR